MEEIMDTLILIIAVSCSVLAILGVWCVISEIPDSGKKPKKTLADKLKEKRSKQSYIEFNAKQKLERSLKKKELKRVQNAYAYNADNLLCGTDKWYVVEYVIQWFIDNDIDIEFDQRNHMYLFSYCLIQNYREAVNKDCKGSY